jgi:nucleotide-binding universal stress UspA family protein
MTCFASILLPLDGSPEAGKGAGCALWLTQTLDATLHVLHAAAQPLAGREALARLHAHGIDQSHVVLHQMAEDAEAAVADAIAAYAVDLVVMSACGASASAGLKPLQRLGSVAEAVIAQSPVPVLLLPRSYREALPWTSMLVAASGDTSADRALATATRLAAALKLPVTVIHAEDDSDAAWPEPLGHYSDAAHHEYPGRVEGIVERALATSTPEECGCVDQALLRCGDVAAVLLEQIAQRTASVLTLGWHGALGRGRALVFKRLLEEAQCPLLVVRRMEAPRAHLKVGKAIDE